MVKREKIWCCYIQENGRNCPSIAEWVVHCPPDPYNITYSCSAHIGFLFDDAPKQAHSYWPIEWEG